MFGMVAGSKYTQLSWTQCEIAFEPSLFTVDVSLVNATIKVSRVEHAQVGDLDPALNLRSAAMDNYWLSYVTAARGTSNVGDAFMESIKSLRTNRSVWSDIHAPDYRSLVLDAITESVDAVIDDSLVALGSLALKFSNAT
ncbi:hypothetical protein BU25DRAFT_211599 [Macroventuria anomochaeta]|uniref:Uncharacterized protein n=1 Tax=Macroventuria anomochaeta TaxID=301207 RepID=A0ACB6RKS4_9PLEO|nr:uncharacterized protein BU25DRAFT_211599 [Macroventuria anomochaeta]KAF2622369.1 hypothetical protein BU25DRAFT_211599 [Macroventuria anomochaeta]